METQNFTQEQVRAEQASFITKVYGWMTLALMLTGIVARWTADSEAVMQFIFGTPYLFMGLLLVELLSVGYLSARVNSISANAATSIFVAYSVLNGITLSLIFVLYTASSISSTFFIAAGTFAVMSIYGYTTKRDLTSIGNLAFMALIGLIIASVVNYFWQNETLYWITTYAGVLIFVALIAYDTQKIKSINMAGNEGTDLERKAAIMGALALYLDFINLFLMLLRLFGRRK